MFCISPILYQLPQPLSQLVFITHPVQFMQLIFMGISPLSGIWLTTFILQKLSDVSSSSSRNWWLMSPFPCCIRQQLLYTDHFLSNTLQCQQRLDYYCSMYSSLLKVGLLIVNTFLFSIIQECIKYHNDKWTSFHATNKPQIHNKNEEEKSQFHWSWRTISTRQWKLKYIKDFTRILGSSQSMCFSPGYVLAIITPVYLYARVCYE